MQDRHFVRVTYIAMSAPGCPILLEDGAICFSYGLFVRAIVDVSVQKD